MKHCLNILLYKWLFYDIFLKNCITGNRLVLQSHGLILHNIVSKHSSLVNFSIWSYDDFLLWIIYISPVRLEFKK